MEYYVTLELLDGAYYFWRGVILRLILIQLQMNLFMVGIFLL